MQAPTAVRFLNDQEWEVLHGVFGSKLPLRYRILLTNGLGDGDAPFSIPTSAISLLTIPAAAQAALTALVLNKLGSVGNALAKVSNFLGSVGPMALASQAAGTVNAGYLVSVGPVPYPNMVPDHKELLVHELTHVWQGANSASSMTYVINSIMHQCRGTFGASGTRNAAYDVVPGSRWAGYNAEQQASLVEKWFVDGSAESGPIWPYIRDHVRKGLV